MKVAVMQPYLFPYLGYFQLIKSVDFFVFYDDVNFIKGGWINRNKLIINKKEYLFSVPLKESSSNKNINEIEVHPELYGRWKRKFLKTIQQSYAKAPHFREVISLVEGVLDQAGSISDIASKSVTSTAEYLKLSPHFYTSSKDFSDTRSLDRADRLIAISKQLGAEEYTNMPGGKDLYSKSYFEEKGIKLNFLEPELVPYQGGIASFIPGLSIIDVLMYNDIEKAKMLINSYEIT